MAGVDRIFRVGLRPDRERVLGACPGGQGRSRERDQGNLPGPTSADPDSSASERVHRGVYLRSQRTTQDPVSPASSCPLQNLSPAQRILRTVSASGRTVGRGDTGFWGSVEQAIASKIQCSRRAYLPGRRYKPGRSGSDSERVGGLGSRRGAVAQLGRGSERREI